MVIFLYQITLLITAIIAFFLGCFIWIKSRDKLVSRLWGFFNFYITVWAFGYFIWCTTSDKSTALLWNRMGNHSAIMIPAIFFHFICELTNLKNRVVIAGSYITSIIILVFALALPQTFIADMVPKVGFIMYPEGGPLFLIYFTLYFFIMVILSFILLFRGYFKSTGIKRRQIKYVLIGTLFCFGGGSTNFFPMFHIPIFPIGNLFVGLYVVFVAYAIVRYRLWEIDTVVHRTIMWALTILFLIIPVCWVISYTTVVWLIQVPTVLRVSILAMVLLFFLGYYHKLKPKVDHLFRRRKYDYQYELVDIPSKIGTELELNVLVERLFGQLRDVLYVQNALLLAKFPEREDYEEVGNFGYEVLDQKGIVKKEEAVFSSDSELIRWLMHHPGALEREQIDINPYYKDIKEETLAFFEANAIEVLIPLVFEENLTGLLGLGKKENLQPYRVKDLELLERLGTQISITIDNALHHKDIVEKQRLQEELRVGRELQISLLPTRVPEIPGIKVYGLMHAAKEIGGDYYDFILHEDEKGTKDALSVAIGDVSGKGLDAGIVMAMTKTIIFSLALQGELSPINIIEKANEILYFHVNLKKFVTLLYLYILPYQNKIRYSAAGHERILIYRPSVPEIEVIKSGGFILGMLGKIGSYLEEKTVTLNKGDKIFLYTDGATEARNPQEELYGLSRLVGSFKTHAHLPIKEAIHSVHQDIKDFISTRDQYDDITLVGIEKE